MSSTTQLPKLAPINIGDGYELDIEHYLTHDYSDVGEAMEVLPAIIEYVNSQLQGIIEQKIVAKQEVKRVEAKAYFDLRGGDFEEAYAGKVTEAALEKAVHLVESVTDVHGRYAVLVGWHQRLSNLIISLQLKLDMVRSTEATRRAGLSADEDKED